MRYDVPSVRVVREPEKPPIAVTILGTSFVLPGDLTLSVPFTADSKTNAAF